MSDDLSDLTMDDRGLLTKKDPKRQKRRGRPKKSEAEKLDQKILLSLSKTELEKLTETAGSVPLATFVRMTLKMNNCI